MVWPPPRAGSGAVRRTCRWSISRRLERVSGRACPSCLSGSEPGNAANLVSLVTAPNLRSPPTSFQKRGFADSSSLGYKPNDPVPTLGRIYEIRYHSNVAAANVGNSSPKPRLGHVTESREFDRNCVPRVSLCCLIDAVLKMIRDLGSAIDRRPGPCL